jgi:putative tricarboxylic transport membrane protein
METTTFRKRNAYLAFGIGGAVFAVGYLGLSFELPFGRLDRPGAGVFPVFVGVVMLVASLATAWEGWTMERVAQVELPAGANRWRLLALIGLLFGYFFALPWLGQIICGVLFSLLLMRVLARVGWVKAAVYSVVLSLTLDLVFQKLLAVPLPHGILGL